jgi:hypothetical protein
MGSFVELYKSEKREVEWKTEHMRTAPVAKKASQIDELAAPRPRGWMDMFVTIYLALHMLWIYTTAMVGRMYVDFVYAATSSNAKQILVIGDDLAYGVGDWATLVGYPGIHRRFNEYILAQANKKILFRGITWISYCFAKSGSTTGEWLPNRMRDAKVDRTTCYFDQCFDKYIGKYGRGAEIVCIMLGMRDRCEPEETVANLRAIVVELLKRGRFVLLATLPVPPRIRSNHEAHRRFILRNQLIEQMMEGVKAEYGEVSGYTGAYVIPIGRMSFEDRMFCFGDRFLSGSGYTRCASQFIDQLAPTMRAVEFRSTIPKAFPMGSAFQ